MTGGHRLLLLRHGEVESHRGDVPVTAAGLELARAVGERLAAEATGPVAVLCGETRRCRETAAALTDGLAAGGADVTGPAVAFALRNPDLYLAGQRVDMVSSFEALAAQVDGLDPGDVGGLAFYPDFILSKERITWWMGHPSPPGEDAASVGARVHAFARSLLDPPAAGRAFTVAVTHSPLLRAAATGLLGIDPGEPDWVTGLDIAVSPGGPLSASRFD